MRTLDAGSARPVFRSTRLASVVLLAVALLGACTRARSVYESPGDVARQPAITVVSIPELATDPEEYVGRTVTIAGEVSRVFGPRWFTIGGPEFGGKEILVLGRSSSARLVQSLADSSRVLNDIVQVTGVVRVFEEDALEREIEGIDLDGDIFDPFDAEPVIVMTELAISPRVDAALPTRTAPAAGGAAAETATPQTVPIVRERDLHIADRASLIGRPVSLYDVPIDTILGSRVLRIGQGQRLILVLNDVAQATASSFTPGQRVYVAGVLRMMPRNLETVRSWWGLSTAADAVIRGEPVYLDVYRVEALPRAAR